MSDHGAEELELRDILNRGLVGELDDAGTGPTGIDEDGPLVGDVDHRDQRDFGSGVWRIIRIFSEGRSPTSQREKQ